MAEIKDKVITVEALSALHEYNKESYMSMTTITIPAGRMRGDIDGDGKITDTDELILQNHILNSNTITDETQLLCADVDGDGTVEAKDILFLRKIVLNKEDSSEYTEYTAGMCEDILGNWTSNPNRTSEKMQFYTDIVVEDLVDKDSIIITILDGDYDRKFFRAERIESGIRMYAELCPISEVKAVVQYGNAKNNETDIIIVDSLCNSAKYLHDVVPIVNGGTNASDGATGLKNLFADGVTVLSSYQYGDELPEAGTVGRIFFKRLVEINEVSE